MHIDKTYWGLSSSKTNWAEDTRGSLSPSFHIFIESTIVIADKNYQRGPSVFIINPTWTYYQMTCVGRIQSCCWAFYEFGRLSNIMDLSWWYHTQYFLWHKTLHLYVAFMLSTTLIFQFKLQLHSLQLQHVETKTVPLEYRKVHKW